MIKTNKVIKNSAIYTLASIMQGAIGFFILPFITRFLTPEEYGVVSVVMSMNAILIVLYTLSLEYAIIRIYHEYKDNDSMVKSLFGNSILISGLFALVVSCILALFHQWLISPILKGIDFYPYLLIGLITVSIRPAYIMFQTSLLTQQKAAQYALNNFLYFILNIVLILLFVVYLEQKATGMLLANLLTAVVFFIYTIFKFFRKVSFKINLSLSKQTLKYSVPLIPDSMAAWVISMTDRIFINNLISTAAAGIYNIGYLFGDIINMLNTAINQAFQPWFIENMKAGEEGKTKIIVFAEIAVLFYSFVAFGISLFGKEVLMIFVGEQFYEAWKLIPVISFIYVFNGMAKFFINPLYYNFKGVKYIPIGTIIAAIFNVVFNIIFVPIWGIYGSAFASVFSMIILSLIMLFFSSKIERINYKWKKMFLIIIVFFLLSSIVYFLPEASLLNMIFIKLAIIIPVTVLLYYCYKTHLVSFYKDFFGKKEVKIQ